jgi:formylglycine-generating enzyme required for sulfatase activity
MLAEKAISAEHGWGIGKRRAFAQELDAGFAAGGRYASAWEAALPVLRTAYPSLALVPQMGLLPLGPDPASTLWEFAHLMTGEPAVRGVDGKLVLREETGIVLVLIPAGSFWMGAQASDPSGRNYDPQALRAEGPVHEVKLSAHFLSKYEVTQGQWERLVGTNPSFYGPGRYLTYWNAQNRGWSALHPVEQVSWLDGMTWLPRAGLSLPSEAQWENGCRAGTSSVFWSGNEKETLRGVANLSDDYGNTHGNHEWNSWEPWLDDGNTCHAVVGSYRPNAYGLYDVHGNGFEWCLDGFDPSFYGRSAPQDPLAPWEGAVDRVLRGGCFKQTAELARSAARPDDSPGNADDYHAIRPARVITE